MFARTPKQLLRQLLDVTVMEDRRQSRWHQRHLMKLIRWSKILLGSLLIMLDDLYQLHGMLHLVHSLRVVNTYWPRSKDTASGQLLCTLCGIWCELLSHQPLILVLHSEASLHFEFKVFTVNLCIYWLIDRLLVRLPGACHADCCGRVTAFLRFDCCISRTCKCVWSAQRNALTLCVRCLLCVLPVAFVACNEWLHVAIRDLLWKALWQV